jgi:hypothetical protein
MKGCCLLIGYTQPKKQNKSVVIVVVTHYDSHTGFLFSLFLSRGRMIRGGRTEKGDKRAD